MSVGSLGVAAWIAPVAFCILVALALVRGRTRVAILFVLVAAVGYLALPRLGAGGFVTSYVAVLDIVLVFIVVGHDVRLT